MTHVTKHTAKFGNTLKNVGKWVGSRLMTPLTMAAKGAGAFSEKVGGLFSAFKRMAIMRIARTIIKEIGKAMAEGAQNAYMYAKKLGGGLAWIAESLDSLSSASHKMGNQFGAAWDTLLAQLVPVINTIIGYVTQAIAVITQFFALLGGKSTYMRATDYAHAWAEETAGGAAAAKEWRNQLMKFDELNRLDDPNKGGGGGSGSALDYNSMFEEAAIEQEIIDFTNRLKQLIADSDWMSIGNIIGEKVNDLIDSINWSSIGSKVGQFVNGLFGTTYWTLDAVNFQNIGKRIANFLTGENGIGGALAEIDFTNLGGIIAEKLTILPDIIIGVINNLDFQQVGKSIGDVFRGFFSNLSKWLDGVNWSELGQTVIDGLVNFFTGLDAKNIAQSIANLLTRGLDAVAEFLGGIDWGELTSNVIDGLVNFAENLDLGGVLDALIGAGGAVLNALDDIWDAVLDYIPNGWTLVKAWFSDYVVRGVAQWGIDIANGLANPIEDGINSLIDKLNGFIANHPKVAEFLGIDQLEHIEFNLIPNLDPPVGAFYQQTKNGIESASKKNPTNVNSKANMTSFATAFTSGALTGAGRPILSVQAKFNSFFNDLTGNKKPAIPTKANLNALINSLTGDKKPSIGTRANLNSVLNSLTGSKKPSVASQANFNSFFNGLTSKKIPSIPSIAQYQWANKDNLTTGQKTIGTIANIFKIDIDKTRVATDGNNIKLNATANVTSVNSANHNVMVRQAGGGVFNGGKWHDIARFAGGGLASGSQLFWAREQGPELVGTLGGHTAVMNNDQIVASVSAGVARAIAGISFRLNGIGAGGTGINEDALYNAMLRALNDSDRDVEIDLDGEQIYKSVLNRNRRETFRTGANPMTATA